MIAWGNTTDRILILLKDNGMTKLEICAALNLTENQVSGVLARLQRRSLTFGKRIYICDWTRLAQGKRYCLRPIFMAGNKANAKKPPVMTQAECDAKWRQKKILIKRSIIFDTREAVCQN